MGVVSKVAACSFLRVSMTKCGGKKGTGQKQQRRSPHCRSICLVVTVDSLSLSVARTGTGTWFRSVLVLQLWRPLFSCLDLSVSRRFCKLISSPDDLLFCITLCSLFRMHVIYLGVVLARLVARYDTVINVTISSTNYDYCYS
jgi:hypothetical protein